MEFGDVWVSGREYRAWELVYLAEGHGLPAERLPRERRGLDAAENAYITH